MSLGNNIWTSNEKEIDETGLRARKKTKYNRHIIYSYIVDGKEFVKSDILESSKKSDIEKFYGNTIQITYNEKKPDKVIIGELNYEKNYPVIILETIIFVGFGRILFSTMSIKKNDIYKTNKELLVKIENGKDTILEVTKIQIIDYEREKVFFESQDNRIYYYETDFGEEFRENQTYKIKLNRYNQERKGKTIRIVNTEKKEFINIE